MKRENLSKLAAEFNRYFTSLNGVEPNARISVPTKEWVELYQAIQEELTAIQPLSADPDKPHVGARPPAL